MSRATWAALLAAAALAGCVSSDPAREVDNKSAADSNVKLGIAYMSQGKMEAAKERLERAEKQDPKSAEAQFALAELYSRLNMAKEAGKRYENAMKMAPDRLEYANGFAAFLCMSGEVDRGIAQFEKLMHNPLYGRQAAAATNAGICLRDQKRHADSVRFFETALAKQPDWIDAAVQLADVLIVLGKPAAARKVVDDFQTMRSSAAVLLLGVRAGVAEGNCRAAQAYSRRLRTDFTNSRETLSLLPQVQGACAGAAVL